MEGNILVEKLIRYAKSHLYLDDLDVCYTRNLLLREFSVKEPVEDIDSLDLSYIDSLTVPDELVSEIENFAIDNGICEEEYKNIYAVYIFGIISPLPSKVNADFLKIKGEKGIEKACEYLYGLSVKNNYVQKTAIEKNLKWEYKDGNNILEITINLSKPEKDNKEIAKLLKAPKEKAKYPKCVLCKENEGFEGSLTHPARVNIRTVSVNLGGEDWFVQYSPYAYFDEHCIAINKIHTPMKVDASTVEKVLDFVDFFPNYMIGSNAALPIIGGSILNHEHFQGGVHLMPMHKAPMLKYYKSKKYPDVEIGVLDWYNSVVRAYSKDRAPLQNLITELVESWKVYTDGDNDIFAETDGTPHNSCSPVCRKVGDRYSIDLILRNNRASNEYPDGIFHAHPEYHNIKKEGIGLIEAMGLFILPGRLKRQLSSIADIMCGNISYDENALNSPDNDLYVHRNMIKDLVSSGKFSSHDIALKAVIDRVNKTCANILDNTAVFKKTAKGYAGFKKFMESNGLTEI